MQPKRTVITGRICPPIRHQDESQEKNVQRLLDRLVTLTTEIEKIEQAAWAEAVKSAYYPARTRGRKQSEVLVRGLTTKLRGLEAQRERLRGTISSRDAGAGGVRQDIRIVQALSSSRTAFNYYELSWITRLLRMIGDEEVVNVDDLRVALPELAFRGNSASRIIEFLRYLDLRLDLRSKDKYSLYNLVDAIYEEPELEADQVNTLLQKFFSAKRRAKELRDIILKAYLRVVLRQACTYFGKGLDLADLFQEGCIGFIAGFDHFQFNKGATFRNYISFWIRQAILRGIAIKSRAIRLPAHVQDRLTESQAMEAEPVERLEENWTDEQAHPEGNGEQASRHFAELQPVGINEMTEEELHSAIERSANTEEVFAGQELDSIEVSTALERILGDLDRREQEIIARRFGLDGREVETLEQIALDYGVTRERIRQIEENAIEKLRHPSRVGALAR